MMNSDCYSAIHSWRANVATLKKNLELPSLLECLFCVNSVYYSPKFSFAESAGDALTWLKGIKNTPSVGHVSDMTIGMGKK